MMLLVRGTAKGLSGERRLEAPATWLNDLLRTLEPGHGFLVPAGIWLVALLALAVAITLQYTRFGRHLFSIGSNERTARLCGVAVDRTKIAVYTIAAALTGVAGVLQFSRLSVGDPTVADGLELNVIAAVIIGGGSLVGRPRHRARHDTRRRHDGRHPDRLRAARLAELGAADRHRRDHRPGRRAGSVAAEGVGEGPEPSALSPDGCAT